MKFLALATYRLQATNFIRHSRQTGNISNAGKIYIKWETAGKLVTCREKLFHQGWFHLLAHLLLPLMLWRESVIFFGGKPPSVNWRLSNISGD